MAKTQIIFNAADAKAAINIVRPAKGSKTMPIFDNYLLTFDKNTVKIRGGNLAGFAEVEIADASANEDGQILVDGAQLERLVGLAGNEPVTIEVGKSLTFYSETGKMVTALGPSVEDYIQFEKPDGLAEISFDGTAAADAFNFCAHAVASDELRPAMNAILAEAAGGKIEFTATDAHRLCNYRGIAQSGGDGQSFLIPKESFPILRKMLDGKVSVRVGQKLLHLQNSEMTAGFRSVEGNYPAWRGVVPEAGSETTTLYFDRVELLTEVKRAMIAANPKSGLVVIDWDGEGTTAKVSAQDIDFGVSAEYKVGLQGEGEALRIGFRGEYLVDALSAISSSEVIMRATDPGRAATFHAGNEDAPGFELLMPLMINA